MVGKQTTSVAEEQRQETALSLRTQGLRPRFNIEDRRKTNRPQQPKEQRNTRRLHCVSTLRWKSHQPATRKNAV